MTPRTRFTLLLTALGAASVAQACEHCDAQKQAQAQEQAQPQATAPTASAMTVVRDAETGQLRAPTAAEAKALQFSARSLAAAKASAAAAATQQPAVRAYASGAHSARLPAGLTSYAVAVRQPDGSLKDSCVDGLQAATEAIQRAPASRTALTKKETE